MSPEEEESYVSQGCPALRYPAPGSLPVCTWSPQMHETCKRDAIVKIKLP